MNYQDVACVWEFTPGQIRRMRCTLEHWRPDLWESAIVGTPFCSPANTNSTGLPCRMVGSFGAGVGSDLHLDANQGPANQFGYFLMGTAFLDPGLAISQGQLCVSGSIGRYNIAGTAFNSIGRFDSSGDLQNSVGTSTTGAGYDVPVNVPVTNTPTISSGSTWHFQLWFREAGGNANFSNGLSVLFP